MQPAWGMLSDRLGRVRVMRPALLASLVPGLLSVLAPNLTVLVVGRDLAGALYAAVIPSAWPTGYQSRPRRAWLQAFWRRSVSS
jgi:MFS family permease